MKTLVTPQIINLHILQYIVKLYKQNKEIEKETGNSVTHLAIGFLSWNEKKTENLNITPDFKAPLFLIPLKITKEKKIKIVLSKA